MQLMFIVHTYIIRKKTVMKKMKLSLHQKLLLIPCLRTVTHSSQNHVAKILQTLDAHMFMLCLLDDYVFMLCLFFGGKNSTYLMLSVTNSI